VAGPGGSDGRIRAPCAPCSQRAGGCAHGGRDQPARGASIQQAPSGPAGAAQRGGRREAALHRDTYHGDGTRRRCFGHASHGRRCGGQPLAAYSAERATCVTPLYVLVRRSDAHHPAHTHAQSPFTRSISATSARCVCRSPCSARYLCLSSPLQNRTSLAGLTLACSGAWCPGDDGAC